MNKKKIVIAADSFKGSASTIEVSTFIEAGIKRVHPNTEVVKIPVADGGEGTVDALVLGCNGEYKFVSVVGPNQEPVMAKYGIINETCAVIEMAEASGLTLVDASELNPEFATSFGTGELINAALEAGVTDIYIGLGGSATNDGGVGMAQALGVSFKDKSGQEIPFGAKYLAEIATIDCTKLNPKLQEVNMYILSDVTNPLCGENGATYVYGPQKGATKEQLVRLEQGMLHYSQKIAEQLGLSIVDAEGAGAAGGVGAGLMAFCQAEMCRGITKILEILKMEEQLEDAHLVITGEGKMDSQSLNGKAPIGIANLAKNYQLPVIAIVGGTDGDLAPVYEHGIDLVLDVIHQPMSLAQAFENVEELITNAGETAMRAFALAHPDKKASSLISVGSY